MKVQGLVRGPPKKPREGFRAGPRAVGCATCLITVLDLSTTAWKGFNRQLETQGLFCGALHLVS